MERKWIRDRGRKKKGNVRTTTEALIAKAETDRVNEKKKESYFF